MRKHRRHLRVAFSIPGAPRLLILRRDPRFESVGSEPIRNKRVGRDGGTDVDISRIDFSLCSLGKPTTIE